MFFIGTWEQVSKCSGQWLYPKELLLRCPVLQDVGPEKASEVAGDVADDVPMVQETVQVIPGSRLLWRINSRPPNSAQVCAYALHPARGQACHCQLSCSPSPAQRPCLRALHHTTALSPQPAFPAATPQLVPMVQPKGLPHCRAHVRPRAWQPAALASSRQLTAWQL